MSKVVSINIGFADEVYKYFLKERYGIEPCCGYDLDKWLIKKENCDLAQSFVPGYCEPEPIIPTPPNC